MALEFRGFHVLSAGSTVWPLQRRTLSKKNSIVKDSEEKLFSSWPPVVREKGKKRTMDSVVV